MRIVAGKYRGARIAAPKGMATRPTTDRTRESLFNILQNRMAFDGIRVLDLFAGSGALGLEAMSRGASSCLFVDDSHAARAAIRQNVETLGLAGQTGLFRRDATRLGSVGTRKPYDLVFADPPYGKGLGERAASSLVEGGWMNPEAVFVLEERNSAFPPLLHGFVLTDRRDYGETTIGLFELA
ncbi:MAG: 16S rRNA (guanine(966)-N(2))-methyltransferase RsmD [Rhizobiaceae bacterium]|nr:16S rRNA (guanine(966)-N(2))-methyltransferase RsmD [Rhizobiaceae bacterium]